jgi:hypothetical protein
MQVDRRAAGFQDFGSHALRQFAIAGAGCSDLIVDASKICAMDSLSRALNSASDC